MHPGTFDEVLTVAAVHPGLADRGVAGGDLVEQAGAGVGVLDAGRGAQDREQEAERIGHDAPCYDAYHFKGDK
ncbi:hypothetical protein LK08_19020 [Streptomyces sp. MUSC 125]|nr:hypothetical protein LK08_19020 [Streptomyces sp. MUSC 125]